MALELVVKSYDLLNTIVSCRACTHQGIIFDKFLHWSELPHYLRGIFDIGWICNQCVRLERAKYLRIRRCVESAKRRAAECQAMPAWADRKAIQAFYSEADRLTRETGIPHHVDHEVPLAGGSRVSGLHVPANLRVIPAIENLKKSNRFDGQKIARESAPVILSGYEDRRPPSTRAIEAWQARKTDSTPRLVKHATA